MCFIKITIGRYNITEFIFIAYKKEVGDKKYERIYG